MFLDKPIRIAFAMFAAAIGGVSANIEKATADNNTAAALPEFRFQVGQELVYRLTAIEDVSEDKEEGQETTPRDKSEVRLFVVDQKDDGSWRLMVRTKKEFITSTGRVRAKWNSLAYCDVAPNGAYAFDERTAIFKKLFPYEFICRLPDQPNQLDGTWAYETPVQRQALQYDLISQDGAKFLINARMTTPYQDMHGAESTIQYDFDRSRGVVDRIAWKHRWGDTVLNRVFKLVSVTQHDSDWINHFHKEANHYLDQSNQWIDRFEVALWSRDSSGYASALNQAREKLVEGRDQTNSEIIREMYRANLNEHDESLDWIAESVAKRETFFKEVPEFPTDWQAKSFDGSTFKLKDQRGKVVVLDFWGTNCEYCVLMAPQVERLVKEFEGENVTFVGMFDRRETASESDAKREQERAQSFIKNVYRAMPHLEAKEIINRYRLDRFGYPLLMVLDRQGVVHELHLGYSGDLARKIQPVIKALISGTPRE